MDFGHELNVDLDDFMNMDDPILYMNSMFELLEYPFNVDNIDILDPVLMDVVQHHIFTNIIIGQIAYLRRLYIHGGEIPDKKGRGAKFCELVTGTIDDRSSWHNVFDLSELTFIDVESISNFDRYDKFAAKRGRIRKKSIKKDANGNNLPYRITYVYRDPSTPYYKKDKPKTNK